MTLLWAVAFLLSLLLFTWNTSNAQLSQHFTPCRNFERDMLTTRSEFLPKIISMIFTRISTQYSRIFSLPQKRNIIFFFSFLTLWLNAIVAMVASPRTPTDIFTTRYITPNIRSSLLSKLYSAGLTLTSLITHRNTLTTEHTQYLATKWISTRTTFLTSDGRALRIYNHFTSIPYILSTSEKVRRVLNEAGVKVVMKPVHIIGGILLSQKRSLILKKKV